MPDLHDPPLDEGKPPLHFRDCHPEDTEASAEVAGEIQDVEACWHCGTPTTRGACHCPECRGSDEYVPQSAVYHCQTCGRWWAYMTGLNITTITFGEEDPPDA
jgi:hypothetical protein